MCFVGGTPGEGGPGLEEVTGVRENLGSAAKTVASRLLQLGEGLCVSHIANVYLQMMHLPCLKVQYTIGKS